MRFLLLLLIPVSVHAACGGDLERRNPVQVSLQKEIDLRVRIMPGGRVPAPLPRFEFEFQGENWAAEIEGAQLLIKKDSEIFYVVMLDGAQDGFRSADFSVAGDHGSLTLESRAKVHVFSLDRPGAQ